RQDRWSSVRGSRTDRGLSTPCPAWPPPRCGANNRSRVVCARPGQPLRSLRGVPMTTAFVLWGGGSLGAAQVGMLRALTSHGVRPDLGVGASAGALNGAYYAARPDAEGVEELARLWLSVSGHDVYPLSGPEALRTLAG